MKTPGDLLTAVNSDPSFASLPADRRSRKGGYRWAWFLVVVLVGSGVIFFQRHRAESSTPAQPAPSPSALPVATATAQKGNLGVYLHALGSVTPLNTVTVKSRVDGQLMSVNYREGQIVRAGDLLAEIDPRPYQTQLTQAEGQYARDKALLENARIDLDRYQELYARDAIPKQQLDTQKATVHQYEGVVKLDQGQIDNVKLQLVYCHITSPIAGRVGLRLVDPGNIVRATDTSGLLIITQLQPITVIFNVAEDNLPQIQRSLRQGRRLAVEAFDRSQQKKIATGSLLTLDNQIDTTTGTVKLKAVFPNADNALFPNQFVNVKLLVDTQRGATLIPTAAIQRNAQSAFVFQVNPDQTVAKRMVSVGVTDGQLTAVQGLKPDDVIAVDGLDKLQDGVKVVAKKAPDQASRGGDL